MKSEVIEYLDLPSKAKFSRCSKTCYKEILGSKNYLKSIKFSQSYARTYEIRFEFFQDNREYRIELYNLQEEDEDDEALYQFLFFEFETIRDEWELKRINVINYAVAYFQRLIDCSTYLKQIDFDFRDTLIFQNFKNIEKLEHLKTFRIFDLRENRETLGENGFEDLELLSKIRKNIIAPVSSLNLEKLLKITARKSKLYDVKMSPKVVKDYVVAVRDGKINENIKKIRLDYDKNQETWDPEMIFETDSSDSEEHTLKVDVLNKETDPERDKAIWFDLNIRGKPERYAKFRLTQKSFLLVIRLQEKRQYYRERAEEYRGEVENDDELDIDSYNHGISDFTHHYDYGGWSDFEF
ncbi:unnamed protein product [Caenorhabditis angaria]|uniref:Uncharacterized protein n=1 Tax=Caenorhabditis angaria TaxID=860376 RepID=A0A9P1ID29_9PELO|nr:unnamed protein product [Caenorhabditis angaria]